MITERSFWRQKIERAWDSSHVIAISGVSQGGKSCIVRTLPDVEYLDCELPRVRRLMAEGAAFLGEMRGRRIVIDGLERLPDPAGLLLSAVQKYPDTRIIASGSFIPAMPTTTIHTQPSLAALWLTPIITPDLEDFGSTKMPPRLLHGGLPQFFLSSDLPERKFQEWMDAYWGREVRDRFRIESRTAFQRFVEMVMAGSGSIFDATRFAAPCGISRTTAAKYLSIMDATYAVHILRPFSTRRSTEIVSALKFYAFDTGFLCRHRGWEELRRDDYPLLWEHFVLNELHGRFQSRKIYYWRDKRGHGVDFVLMRKWMTPIAIQCAWSQADFDLAGLKAFRYQYPNGESYVVCNDVDGCGIRSYGDLEVRFLSLSALLEAL